MTTAQPELRSDFDEFMKECGYLHRTVHKGQYHALMPLILTTAIITGRADRLEQIDRRWCHEHWVQAALVFGKWKHNPR